MAYQFVDHPIVNELRAAVAQLRADNPETLGAGDELQHVIRAINVVALYSHVPPEKRAEWPASAQRTFDAAIAAAEYLKSPGSGGL